ncbi:23S rRNA (guanine(745)-N(1))-methyltransferase [Psychrobium sp. 1_MG-2023]|uniref:23S rRNA (guanine(745)-N(1))-methyltransferase n=1 Tax=Psychrobium sp. 1_MG-2023 TaxID=3062624 RepID=UPI000C3467E0|nr:23S rRNA (guanine(745)-N(1))-methyltransferase [Psychrobium sp. 1_MG-2023]MDP2560225.1 23S rRNA (guanine(745)-N(1))-methyltransferase [Psychrobium sp. 1_MG-2023]PKF57035.1 23S rRNA (guanine(745)-N(1))-methyltransferase [Alteromonadales bacterium alter-6D02]
MFYACPICDQQLVLSPSHTNLSCSNNHQFDRAKQGYFNLLPVQRKKSKQPGDSKEMISARHDFLNADYYQPLAEKIAQIIKQQQVSTLLDLGCGEGYYTRQVKQRVTSLDTYGVDISKPAIIKAAKQDKQGHYSVASSDKLPLVDNCIDLILKVYAPANEDELKRVVTDKGLLLTITPGPRHLWQLREYIYQDVRAHDTQDTVFKGFKRMSSENFSFTICPTDEHRVALLQMTPFAWKANEVITEQIQQAQNLNIELDFVINLYQTLE